MEGKRSAVKPRMGFDDAVKVDVETLGGGSNWKTLV